MFSRYHVLSDPGPDDPHPVIHRRETKKKKHKEKVGEGKSQRTKRPSSVGDQVCVRVIFQG